jgi:hypothetical protein
MTTQENQQPKPAQALAIVEGHGDGRSINAFSSTEAFVSGQRMAKAISLSSLLPKDYQDNIPNVMIAMELASAIGMPVLTVMQNIDMIHGRPSWRATFLIATVNTCGRFTALRYRFEGVKGTPSWGCCAVAKDRETGEELVGESITIKMADDEGWSKKTGSKWKTMPGQMLRYRAAAFWSRVYAPELSLGMHTAEEVEDIGRVSSERQNSASAPAVSALVERLARPPEAAPIEPTVEPEPDPDEREAGDDRDDEEHERDNEA